MTGTLVNTATIIVGSVLGAFLKRGIRPELQTALFNAMGLCALLLGANAFCQNMPQSGYPVLFIVSIAAGTLLGYAADFDGRFKRLVDGRRGEAVEASAGEGKAPGATQRLSDGLMMAILLYCVGTFSMIGPVLSALYGDNTFLYTNATLDLVTSTVLATTFGIGVVWAAPVLFCWQGLIYMIARMSEDIISDELRTELCIVGGVLIAASGLGLLKVKDCKVINMLPAFVVVILFFVVKGLFSS